MNQSKKVTEGALFTTVFIILMIMTVFVPGLAMISMFILPIPFIMYSYKYDWKPALMMLSVALVLSSVFASIVLLPLTIIAGSGGIMIGVAMHRHLKVYEIWARGTIGFVIGLLLVFVFLEAVLQVNVMQQIEGMLNESFDMSKKMMEDFGAFKVTEEDWKLIEDRLALMLNLIPVGITIVSFVFAFISQWLSYKVLNRLQQTNLKFPPLRTLRLPIMIVWIYFLAMIIILMDIDQNSLFYLIVHNVHSLAGMLMVLQGFSFMFFITHRQKWPKILPVIGVILTIVLPIVLLYFVRILGIIDLGFRIRDGQLKGKK